MKYLNPLLLAFSVLFLSSLSFARPTSTFKGNIGQGHWFISGGSGLGFAHTSYNGGGSSSAFELQTTTGYFVDSGLGLGGTLNLYSTDYLDRLSIGPTALYYLVADDRIGVPLTGTFFLQHYNRSSRKNTNVAFEASIGFQYFISSTISFGPALRFKQVVGDTEGGLETHTLGVLANFSLFL